MTHDPANWVAVLCGLVALGGGAYFSGRWGVEARHGADRAAWFLLAGICGGGCGLLVALALGWVR